jgi:uncharacterized membrane protein
MFGVVFGRGLLGLYKGLWVFSIVMFIYCLWPLVVWRMSGDGAEPFLGCEDGVEF